MTSPSDIVIVAAKRTPQGRIMGNLSAKSAVQLGGHAVNEALNSSGVDREAIDAVVVGQVVQAGCGQNPARQTAIQAGIGLRVPAVTLNSVCLSGLRAVIEAARLIRLGEAATVVAAGQESMSQAPHLLKALRSGLAYGSAGLLDAVELDALTDAEEGISMGQLTERGNQQLGISREKQDTIAVLSHQRALAAQSGGVFDAEIAPMEISQGRGDTLVICQDEGIRSDSSLEKLSRLRPAFAEGGSITAGNSSPLSDGAAAVVLTTRERAEAQGLKVLARLVDWSNVAGPDSSLHYQPANAIQSVLKKAGWEIEDLDFLEINEAFASVSVASIEQLNVDRSKVNINGGAIALGHPVGASGARLVVHASHELARRGSGKAVIALCGGGGQGDALLLEA